MTSHSSIDRTSMCEMFARGFGVEDVQVIALGNHDRADRRAIEEDVRSVWREFHAIPQRRRAA